MEKNGSDKATAKERAGSPGGSASKPQRRDLQDRIYLAALGFFRQAPEEPSSGLVLAALAFGAYHLVGKGLQRLADLAERNPAHGAIESVVMLAHSRQPKVPLNPELSRRLQGALARGAEALVRSGGDMRTATRLLTLDPRLALLFLKGRETLSEREVYALASVLTGEGRRAALRLGDLFLPKEGTDGKGENG